MDAGFENYTERARRVLMLAQAEAENFNHNYIGTEHLLLGLIRENEGLAAKALQAQNLDTNRVRKAVEFIIGRGTEKPTFLGNPELTPRSKKVLALAEKERDRFNHHYVGTEHILLGLLKEGEGIGAGVLESLGCNYERVVKKVESLLEQSPRATSPSPIIPAATVHIHQKLDLWEDWVRTAEAYDTMQHLVEEFVNENGLWFKIEVDKWHALVRKKMEEETEAYKKLNNQSDD